MDEENVEDLKIKAIIGFDGSVLQGFIVHPDKKHVVYPIGNKIAIQNWTTKAQHFLSGHTNIVSAIDVSKSGKYIASGQINHIGFKARVIIWDYASQEILSRHDMHKVRVEAISFSKDEQFCISMGGRDCNSLVIWNMSTMQALCGGTAAHGTQGDVITLIPMNLRGACFITGGDNHIAIWKIDKDARNIRSIDISTARLKRKVLCMSVNERDEMCYCGTATGDILKICLNFSHDVEILEPSKPPIMVGCYGRVVKKKTRLSNVSLYSQGVRSIFRLPNGHLIIGGGDGTVELVQEIKPQLSGNPKPTIKIPSQPSLQMLRSTTVHACVTSLQLLNNNTILAGTTNSEIFSIDLQTFETVLLLTSHNSTIYDVVFPANFSEVFATAGKNDVRIWSMSTMQELLRIRVQNFFCSNVLFSYDGKSILTSWNDGIIRAFTPLTGRLIYAILNAHNKGVSALAATRKGDRLVSGGCEGQIRLWAVNYTQQWLLCTLKEHNAPISSININQRDSEAVSASTDGTCIIWDLVRQCPLQLLSGNTLFLCACYYPTGVQVLTCGSNRKLSYWEVFDGSLVREIEGSRSGAVNCIDISPNGKMFLSGGNDQIVKLWKYNEGITTHIGLGHSAAITTLRFSPNGKNIISVDASGGIFVWECPFDVTSDVDAILDRSESNTVLLEKISSKLEKNDEIVQDLASVRSTKSDNSLKNCKCCKIVVCPSPIRSMANGDDISVANLSIASRTSRKSK